jgi:hypothetical protein
MFLPIIFPVEGNRLKNIVFDLEYQTKNTVEKPSDLE